MMIGRTSLALAIVFWFGIVAAEANTALMKAFFEQREVVATVYFATDSNALGQDAAAQLAAQVETIRRAACPNRLLRVEGFSAGDGSAESNFRLSLHRAYAVAKFLEGEGIPCLAGLNGYGDLQSAGAVTAADRRVEIVAYPRMYFFDFANARQVDERRDRP